MTSTGLSKIEGSAFDALFEYFQNHRNRASLGSSRGTIFGLGHGISGLTRGCHSWRSLSRGSFLRVTFFAGGAELNLLLWRSVFNNSSDLAFEDNHIHSEA